tara:strand:+ start:481 stop:1467 length:987 start_codon:yes stop_codon:yes gene_type:complete
MNRESIKSYIKKAKPELKESSIKQYISSISSLSKLAGVEKDSKSMNWANDYTKVLGVLGEMESIHTRRNKSAHLLSIMQWDPNFQENQAWQKYKKYNEDLNDTVQKGYESHVKTEKQKENWITKEDIDAIIEVERAGLDPQVWNCPKNMLTPAMNRQFQDYLLLKLYAEMPSRNDFANVKLITVLDYKNTSPDDRQNYLVLQRDNFHFKIHEWKTKSGKTDVRTLSISPELQKDMRKLFMKQPHRKYLFYQYTPYSGEYVPMQRANLGKRLRTIFKKYYPDKNIASNMMRHILLSDHYKDVDLVGSGTKSMQYGHTITTGMKYAVKEE